MANWRDDNILPNRLWKNIICDPCVYENHEADWSPPKYVLSSSKNGFYRQKFDEFLFENGCYLEVKNSFPYIRGFTEENLTMLILKYS